jgi:hypothetical protein
MLLTTRVSSVSRFTEEQKPPKRPVSAYILFTNKYRTGRDAIGSLKEAQAMTVEAAKVWAALSDHEKQVRDSLICV